MAQLVFRVSLSLIWGEGRFYFSFYSDQDCSFVILKNHSKNINLSPLNVSCWKDGFKIKPVSLKQKPFIQCSCKQFQLSVPILNQSLQNKTKVTLNRLRKVPGNYYTVHHLIFRTKKVFASPRHWTFNLEGFVSTLRFSWPMIKSFVVVNISIILPWKF